jgi:putative aldouronate transport system substrate-binding protein
MTCIQEPVRTAKHYDASIIQNTTVTAISYGFADPVSIAKNEVFDRKDWCKLGLAVPKTLDDLYNVMVAFTKNDPDGNGKNDTYGYGAFQEINNYEEWPGRRLEPILGAFGVEGTWDMTKANAGLNILKPEFYDAMVFIKKIQDAGVIDPNWLAYKKDDFRAAWKQGRFGIMREQNAAYAATSNYAPFDKNFPNGEWIVIDPPVGPTGKASIGPYTVNYRIYAVSAKAAKAGKLDKIAQLLEWMASDEGYYLLGWGVEGVNYTKDANGIPVADGVDKDLAFSGPKGQTVTQLRNMVFYNGDIELGSRYPTYQTATSGKTMSALTVMRDMQSRKWTPAIGSDMLPIPNADLKRFYEQGSLSSSPASASLPRRTGMRGSLSSRSRAARRGMTPVCSTPRTTICWCDNLSIRPSVMMAGSFFQEEINARTAFPPDGPPRPGNLSSWHDEVALRTWIGHYGQPCGRPCSVFMGVPAV